MLRVAKFTAIIILSLVVVRAHAQSGQTITGGIEVTRGAIQQLQEELVKRASNSRINASDYKAWSAEFVHNLNQATEVFSYQVETGIIQKMQPLVNQYKTIATDPELRTDQKQALLAAQLVVLNNAASQLAPFYGEAYMTLLRSVIPWLPFAEIKSEQDRQYTKPYGFIGSCGLLSRCRIPQLDVTVSFQVVSLDGKQKPIRGTLAAKELGYGETDHFRKLDLLKTIEENLSPKTGSNGVIYEKFIIPNIKQGCKSSICLTLKEADLRLAMSTFAKDIDRPLEIAFDDGQHVDVGNPNIKVKAYDEYFSRPIVDSSLPFDTGN